MVWRVSRLSLKTFMGALSEEKSGVEKNEVLEWRRKGEDKIFLSPSPEPVPLLNPKLVEVSPGRCCLSSLSPSQTPLVLLWSTPSEPLRLRRR